MATKHLWEVTHPYYCNEGNYFAARAVNRLGPHYKTFGDFLEEWGNADLDMNLVFRWDWTEGDEETSNYNGDDNYRNGTFKVFILGQRKGIYNWATVEVCRADEQAVKDYLHPRMRHLMSLWSPLIEFLPEDTEQ